MGETEAVVLGICERFSEFCIINRIAQMYIGRHQLVQ